MKIDLDLIQLNKDESLFLAGKNFGAKIQRGVKNITDLYYDTEKEMAYVVCEGYEAAIRGFMSIVFKKAQLEQKLTPQVSHPMTANAPRTAQVSNPTTEVQNPMKRGRPPRFQGEEVK